MQGLHHFLWERVVQIFNTKVCWGHGQNLYSMHRVDTHIGVCIGVCDRDLWYTRMHLYLWWCGIGELHSRCFYTLLCSLLLVQTDWKLWPTAQAINFFFVPAKLRVTYVNSVTFVWTVYLSYMKHKVSSRNWPHYFSSYFFCKQNVITPSRVIRNKVYDVGKCFTMGKWQGI